MKPQSLNCEIYPVPYRSSFRWKWRRTNSVGGVEESTETYGLYYECVLAARNSGYQPAFRTP